MESWFEYGYLGLFAGTFLAATVVPFSSELLLSAMLLAGFDPVMVVLVALAGNWSGGMTSYLLGWLGKWEWLEKYFKTDKAKVETRMKKLEHYGTWLALLTWLPVVGDVISIGLGFVRAKWFSVALLSALGRGLRFSLLAWLILEGKVAFGG